jgi:CubicO group peptidase (beta-lactamase class C family)
MACSPPFANTRKIVLVFLTAIFCIDALAQDPKVDFTAMLSDITRKHNVPAMTAAVVNSDGLIQAGSFGVRKRGTNDKVALTDRFPLGSCTKSMTATLAAVLVESKKIDWNTTIGEVWPKATDKDIHPKLKTVTLDQLLSHQSGLPENLEGDEWLTFFEEKETPNLERRRMLKLVLSKPPATRQGAYAYSNLGYVIAAAMLETRAAEPYEALMKKHVFDPLEMQSADFRTMESAKKLTPPMLWGHLTANGEPMDPRIAGAENPSVYASAGTVHVSIEDYAKYARWHLVGKPEPVLRSQSSLDHLHSPQVDSDQSGAKYACGWICFDVGFGPVLQHGGSNTHSYALIWVVPKANIAAVVCTNTGEPQAFPACDAMVAELLKNFAGRPDAKPDADKIDPKRLEGRYQLTPNFIFDVKYKDGHMMVGITNQPTQEVFADSPTKWSYRGVDATLEFHLRDKGPAYAVTLHQNGPRPKAKRIGD